MNNVHSGNATTNDLWAALSQASGKDVNVFMVGPTVAPFCRADSKRCRTHGSERLVSQSLPSRKSLAKLASTSRVSFKQEM